MISDRLFSRAIEAKQMAQNETADLRKQALERIEILEQKLLEVGCENLRLRAALQLANQKLAEFAAQEVGA